LLNVVCMIMLVVKQNKCGGGFLHDGLGSGNCPQVVCRMCFRHFVITLSMLGQACN